MKLASPSPFLACLLVGMVPNINAADFGLVTVESLYSFEDTYSNLTSALDANSAISIANEWDHAAMAESAGLDLLPNSVVAFANPALGTPIMVANRMAGIDLPQKMLVWETDDGNVSVAYNAVDYFEARYGIDIPELETIAGALANLASAATGVSSDAIALDEPGFTVPDDSLSTSTSDADFETTWSRLLAAIEMSPANVAYTVDHGENSAGVLPPTRLVVFGNPVQGTPLIASSPTSGIDLPLKILVWTDDSDEGEVKVTTNSLNFVEERHGIQGVDLEGLETAVTNFVNAATMTASSSGSGSATVWSSVVLLVATVVFCVI